MYGTHTLEEDLHIYCSPPALPDQMVYSHPRNKAVNTLPFLYGWIKLQKAMMSLNKYERCTFKTRHGCLYVNVSEGNRLSSETYRWHFYFILPMMPDKAAFMSVDGAALCTVCINRYIKPLLKHHLVAEN